MLPNNSFQNPTKGERTFPQTQTDGEDRSAGALQSKPWVEGLRSKHEDSFASPRDPPGRTEAEKMHLQCLKRESHTWVPSAQRDYSSGSFILSP